MDRSLFTRTQARNGVSELQCRRRDELSCVKITVGRKRVLVSYCQNGAGNFLRIIDGRKRIHVPSQCFHRLAYSLNTLERVLEDYKSGDQKRGGDSLDVDATQDTLGQPKLVQDDVSGPIAEAKFMLGHRKFYLDVLRSANGPYLRICQKTARFNTAVTVPAHAIGYLLQGIDSLI